MILTPGLSRNLQVRAVLKSYPRSGIRSGSSSSQELLVAPISSYEPILTERPIVDNPARARQTFVFTEATIETGMYLEVEGIDYPIKGVAPYPNLAGTGATFYQLIIEDILK